MERFKILTIDILFRISHAYSDTKVEHNPCALPEIRTDKRPDPGGPPTKVTVGIRMFDLQKINDVLQTLTGDLVVRLTWTDPRLAGFAGCQVPLAAVWSPQIDFLNSGRLFPRGPDQANLSKSMQWLGTTYTTRFNRRHSRNGHLFQGRYKSILVENDSYLLQLSYYVHRNPLRAGLVKRLIDYKWSSYPAYAYDRSRPEWLKTELILSQFDETDKHRSYREEVQKYSDEKRRI